MFPQGFAAVADRLSDFKGVNMLCDIGNGTMNIMFINDKKAGSWQYVHGEVRNAPMPVGCAREHDEGSPYYRR